MLEPGLPANQAPRFVGNRALSFIAGKPRSHRRSRSMWERCLPANQSTRCFRHTTFSTPADIHALPSLSKLLR